MTTICVAERGRVSALFPWRGALAAGVMVVLSFALPVRRTEAEERASPMLERAHGRLERLMTSSSASAAETKAGLIELRSSLRPLSARLRYAHSALADTLDAELGDALAQVEGGDALDAAHRAEFVGSYLVPIAQTLSDASDAIGGVAR